jgi:methionyl-tRNA formyltransferase
VSACSAQGFKASLCRHASEIDHGWILFILGCTRILDENILNKNTYNLVVHESALPKGKGFAPMSWQILAGQNEIPISLISAATKVDSGDIWLTDTIKLLGHELHDEWRNLQGLKTIELCLKFIAQYPKLQPQKQNGEESFYTRRTPSDSMLDINQSVKDQFNLLRIVDNKNYPAYFKYRGKKYTLTITSNHE